MLAVGPASSHSHRTPSSHLHRSGTNGRIVARLVSETDGNAVAMEGPKFLDQAVFQFSRPFPFRNAMISDRPVTNSDRFLQRESSVLGKRHSLRIARIPRVLRQANFLDGVSRVNGGSGGRTESFGS
jgi:hypothetical protein